MLRRSDNTVTRDRRGRPGRASDATVAVPGRSQRALTVIETITEDRPASLMASLTRHRMRRNTSILAHNALQGSKP